MRLTDADELMEHIGRDKLDSREAIMEMVKNASTIEPEVIACGEGVAKALVSETP